MAKRKKNSSNCPRRKRLRRPGRLIAAKVWLPTYNGKNIVRGYCRWFGCDLPCAIAELQMLGIYLTPAYVTDALASHKATCEQRQNSRKIKRQEAKRQAEEWPHDHDDHYAFIAGYTSWGFAYGITWEEWNNNEELCSSVGPTTNNRNKQDNASLRENLLSEIPF